MTHLFFPASRYADSFVRLGSRGRRKWPLSALRRPFTGDSGTSMVEFAVSVPILFMVLLGFIQLCLALYSNFCINEAARDAARWAAVRGSTSCTDAPGMSGCNATSAQIQSYAQNIGYPGIIPNEMSVSASWLSNSGTTPATWSTCAGSNCNKPGNAVQVVVSYPFLFQIPFAGESTWQFSSTAQMVIAQ